MGTRKATKLAKTALVAAINASQSSKTSLSKSRSVVSRSGIVSSSSSGSITSFSRPQITNIVDERNDIISANNCSINFTRKLHSSTPNYYSATGSSQVSFLKL